MKDTNHKLTPVEEAAQYFYPYAVLDMMAEDYESRQRKKNKFGGGTSNRKDPEYEEQEDLNGYNYVGKGDMRGLYQVPNSSEYRGYWTADGHPIGIDWETGNLVDEVTGDIGIMNLPEITVTGTEKPHTYATSMSANLPLGPTIFNPNGVQESTLGQKAKAVEDVSRGMRVLSPSAWMDTAYDAMYTPEEINFPWMEGNQGLGDPFLDLLFDLGIYKGLQGLSSSKIVPKSSALLKLTKEDKESLDDIKSAIFESIFTKGAARIFPSTFPKHNLIYYRTPDSKLDFLYRRVSDSITPNALDKVDVINTSQWPTWSKKFIPSFYREPAVTFRGKRIFYNEQALRNMMKRHYRSIHGIDYDEILPFEFNNYLDRVLTHEASHIVNAKRRLLEKIPPPPGFNAKLTGHEEYFTDNDFDEVLARGGGQYKSEKELSSSQDALTVDDVSDYLKNYPKYTNLDNNMSDMAKGVENIQAFTDWLNQYAPLKALPIGIRFYKNMNNNEH